MQRSFREILNAFTTAVEAGDGAQFSALFTEDGIYDDVFYGEYRGREAIAEMLEGRFHRDGENFLWRMLDPVDDGSHGYARWLFSYDCKLPHIKGKRICMDGVGLFELRDGLIARYEDAVRTAELLAQLAMPTEKQSKVVGKMLRKQLAHPGWAEHRK
ncbi:MAG: nuclear transport factor 2 family protein [Alphaproteobacteria bacterium]|jgi:limonene-1,2-epoxide hydrolase|nr:nuclear transport factor 2 family protein [Alphaproteobacteria bacterium]|tara:strand:- start:87 stop:560 length:474 start_codon:yes stop_codon:yes gene_type:complete